MAGTCRPGGTGRRCRRSPLKQARIRCRPSSTRARIADRSSAAMSSRARHADGRIPSCRAAVATAGRRSRMRPGSPARSADSRSGPLQSLPRIRRPARRPRARRRARRALSPERSQDGDSPRSRPFLRRRLSPKSRPPYLMLPLPGPPHRPRGVPRARARSPRAPGSVATAGPPSPDPVVCQATTSPVGPSATASAALS